MQSIDSLISDLAFILLLGAVVTLLVKWIKQPVVLGYIVAGFLASPNFEPLPSVTTEANIEFWAQIGIVVLLFSLGLEFSFKKLVNTGGSALVTALVIVAGMMVTGFFIGHALGFTHINSLFLGGMLSMSSTTIIIKAFTDLNLIQKKFASLVFAVLIVEDLFAVVMMVVLSSIAINNSVAGGEMLLSVSKLVFFLIIWFLVGVFVLPSALNRFRRHLNNETLLVVSMGLCLGMAVFSVLCGFSLALGAFVMGSILAGTSYAERIEHVCTPVKDLFGSVFFISVGMMVQPGVIVQYWWPILVLSLVVVGGMIVFGTFGMLITGQPLRIALESGFSLTQIGEFAFIIATLGMSLGVLNAEIYPIVVAVSVLTTFTTPYFIRMADPVYNWLAPKLPSFCDGLISGRTRTSVPDDSERGATRRAWMSLGRRYLWRILTYSIILVAIGMVSGRYMTPKLMEWLPSWGRFCSMIVTLVFMAPFLLALCLPPAMTKGNERERLTASQLRVPRIIMMVFRLVLAMAFLVHAISMFYSLKVAVLLSVAVMLILIMFFSKKLIHQLRSIESQFFNNLNERELRRSGKNNNLVSNLHLAYIRVGYACPFVGERLVNSHIRERFGISVVMIQRGSKLIVVPAGDTRIFPADVIGVIGTDEQIAAVLPVIDSEPTPDADGPELNDFKLTDVALSDTSPLIGQTLATADVRRNYQIHVVALERYGEFFDHPASIPLMPADRLWIVGTPAMAAKIK